MSEKSPPLKRRGAAVHEAILQAALAEIAEHGIDEASVAGTAARAGVHETSIYRRFDSREALVVAALLASSEERVAVPDTGSLRGDLVAVLHRVCASMEEPLGLALLRSSRLALTGKYVEERQSFWISRVLDFLVIFERAEARGEISPGTDGLLALELLVAPVHSRLLVTGIPVEQDFAERVVDLILSGLVP